MLKKGSRIDARTHKTLQTKRSVRVFTTHLVMRVSSPSPLAPKPTFSVVISKKIEKTAVARNTARRRLYALIREIQKENVSMSGTYVFQVQKKIDTLTVADLRDQIDFLLKKAKI